MGIGQVISQVNANLRPAIFLDRDGVLNHTVVINGVPHPPQSVGELQILPGVEDAISRLSLQNLPLIVVTNQPDVARGAQSREQVEQINDALHKSLPQLTAIYTCFHDTPDHCLCRKPKPGLLTEAARAYNINLSRSFMVGDRWSDIVAGQAAGCRTVLIDLAYSKADRCEPDFRAGDLGGAVEIIRRELQRT
jgi:D-glycero-D-manno-heptose 1,7-bisphosphate phosphatase